MLRVAMCLLLFCVPLRQDRTERKCEAAVTESFLWCFKCNVDVELRSDHDGHDMRTATVCVRKVWANGCCVKPEAGDG